MGLHHSIVGLNSLHIIGSLIDLRLFDWMITSCMLTRFHHVTFRSKGYCVTHLRYTCPPFSLTPIISNICHWISLDIFVCFCFNLLLCCSSYTCSSSFYAFLPPPAPPHSPPLIHPFLLKSNQIYLKSAMYI